MEGKVNGIPECGIRILEVTQLPKTLETSHQGVAEVAETTRLVRVTMRHEANSISAPRNCVLDVTQLAEALESSEKGVAEVVEIAGFLSVVMRDELNSITSL